MNGKPRQGLIWLATLFLVIGTGGPLWAQEKKPNILVIWGDDIGITNISAYSSGLMGYRTPNIDRLAGEGMRFTDAYGEQSCTAGRSSFITGQSVYRTGLSKVGIPGSPIGLQAEDPTFAELLKPLGYATGQFGKNHLGDLNKFLPTVHGFDEFFGNLYHLNAEEEPEMADYPPEKDFPQFRKRYGPRGMIHSWATGTDDATEQPRWGTRRQAADRGYWCTHGEAHGDHRRRDDDGGQGLHQTPARSEHAVLRVDEHDAHALHHSYEAREPRAGGAVAVAVPRHDD
jgi:arylsulfatase A-like enzyme